MSRKLRYSSACVLLIASVFFIVQPHLCSAEDLETVRNQYNNDVAAVTKRFESMIPPEARNVDGTPMKDHPAYKKVKEQYDTAIKNVQKGYEANNEGRIQQHKEVMDSMPPELAKKIESTGRDPASIHSDYDFSADFDAANAYAKKMKNLGNEVIPQGDRFIIKGNQDTTVWIKNRAGSDPVGSISFEAEIAHKANVDSDAYLSVGDNTSKKVEILDHTRKFVHAKNSGDIRVQGKTLLKITKTAGATPGDPGTVDQSNKLYNENATVEQAGIVDFGDPPEVKKQKIEGWTKKAENTITDIHKKVDAQSNQEYANLDNQIKQANEAGDTAKVAELKKAKIKNNLEVKGSLEAISESDPEFGGKLTGNEVKKITHPDGSIAYMDGAGNTMSKSEFVRMTGKNVLKDLKSTYKSMLNPTEPIIDYVKNPASRTAAGGFFATATAISLIETYYQKKKEQKPWETEIEVAGKTLWEVTGIPGAIETGSNAADAALKEYDACVKAGRKDCSKVMTVLKANYNAVKDTSVGMALGLGGLPGYVITTPIRWADELSADKADEKAKEMQKRVDDFRPIAAARKLAEQLVRLAGDVDDQLTSLDALDTQAWQLQRQIISPRLRQDQLQSASEKLQRLCGSAQEITKQIASVKNPAELSRNIVSRLKIVKETAAQTCDMARQTVEGYSAGRIDDQSLESYKTAIKAKYLDQAENQYGFAGQELKTLKGPAGESASLLAQIRDAQNELAQYVNDTNALLGKARPFVDEYNKRLVKLNGTVNEFNDTRLRFFTGVKYFFQAEPGKEQEELLDLSRKVDKLVLNTKSGAQHEARAKDFYAFAVGVEKLTQMRFEPCVEADRLAAAGAQGRAPLIVAFDDAGQTLARGRECYANLKGVPSGVIRGALPAAQWSHGGRYAHVYGQGKSAYAGGPVLLPVDRQWSGIAQPGQFPGDTDRAKRESYHHSGGIQSSGRQRGQGGRGNTFPRGKGEGTGISKGIYISRDPVK